MLTAVVNDFARVLSVVLNWLKTFESRFEPKSFKNKVYLNYLNLFRTKSWSKPRCEDAVHVFP